MIVLAHFSHNFTIPESIQFMAIDNLYSPLAVVIHKVKEIKQELSYRKQIARQLRTQYVEGIHRPKYYTVTLKSMSRVTQDHCKRNQWTDHTRLTIVELFDVEYYRDLEMWVKGHSRSLKVIPFESMHTV